jgi:RND family efflux transporter MFP subunit
VREIHFRCAMRKLANIIGPLALSACAAPPQPAEQVPIAVSVAQVRAATEVERVSSVGTVRLRQETNLGFTSPGRIARISVNAGDHVAKGQLLATLDMTTVEAQLGAASAEQVRAAAELRRAKTLLAGGWVSQARVDTAQAAYDSAIAGTRVRRFATDTARIIAPSAGIVLARPAEPSQVVDSGTPVIVLGEEARGYVLKVPLADREIARIALGAAATVQIASLGGSPIEGHVVEIGGRADQGTGTFEAQISLPVSQGLRSGQIGRVAIVARDQAAGGMLLVPPAAIFSPRAGEGFVYVLPQGSDRVVLRKVSIGEAQDDGVHVLKGVAPGEWVIVSGIDRLRDKQRVRAQRRAG